jgi:hypothetical protein
MQSTEPSYSEVIECMSVKTQAIILFIIMLISGCAGATPAPTLTPLPTATFVSPTLMSHELPTQSTSTTIPTYTATSAASAVYYQIVLDASSNRSADWDSVQTSAQKILDALEPTANYSLITIGASPPTEGVDPCLQPSVARTPFTAQRVVSDTIKGLQPAGGGSLYTAVRLALSQFEAVPDNTLNVLIVITGSADACQRDEWSNLEQQFKVNAQTGVQLHTEMIVVDAAINPAVQTVTDRIVKASKSKNVKIQFATDAATLSSAADTLINNVKAYVTNGLATRPTEGALSSSFTLTPKPGAATITPGGASSFTLTPKPGELTATLSASSYTLTPRPGTATFTPTITFTPVPITFTATLQPSATLSPTATLPPSVTLVSANYRTKGIGCQVDIMVKVTGSPARGSFHVMNSSNTPNGEVYPEVFLPIGSYGNNIVMLDGNQPATYHHEVWFEYGGLQTNHLTGLICPLIPKATPTP